MQEDRVAWRLRDPLGVPGLDSVAHCFGWALTVDQAVEKLGGAPADASEDHDCVGRSRAAGDAR